jgi:hypothetical protein
VSQLPRRARRRLGAMRDAPECIFLIRFVRCLYTSCSEERFAQLAALGTQVQGWPKGGGAADQGRLSVRTGRCRGQRRSTWRFQQGRDPGVCVYEFNPTLRLRWPGFFVLRGYNSANAPGCKSRTTASTRSHSKSHDNDVEKQGAMTTKPFLQDPPALLEIEGFHGVD